MVLAIPHDVLFTVFALAACFGVIGGFCVVVLVRGPE